MKTQEEGPVFAGPFLCAVIARCYRGFWGGATPSALLRDAAL